MLSSTWARLVGGISPSTTPTKRTDQRTEQRVARFARVYKQLLQSCRRLSGGHADAQLVDHVCGLLEQLTSMLRDEVRTPVPHPCFSFAVSQGLADTAVKATQTVHDEAVVRAGIATFSALINGSDDLLGDEGFAKSLMALTDTISRPQSVDVSSDTVAAVVELRFEVAAKMRLQPDILPAWFIPGRAWRRSSEEARRSAPEANGLDSRPSDKNDFPLFYSLIDHVHYESPIGDFARTGLLYIIETASSIAELERWVIESDLATLMASGLGALYSQLSRKLVVTFSTPELPPILALSDYATPIPADDTQLSASPEYAVHLGTLLSDLMFWQDVLDHCPSAEIKRTLLDHFEILFLKQVLYPSLIESSDVDGGSSVAALTYLHRMLESLRNPELVKVTLEYLLAVPEPVQPERPRPHRSPSALKRRKTLDSVSKLPNADAYASPKLFSLVDLINASLRSPNQQAVAATLKVASVLLRCHHFYALSTLIQAFSTTNHERRTVGGHEQEIDSLLLLAASISDVDDGDESYEGYGQDALSSIENHPCSESSLSKERPASTKSPPAQRAAPGKLRKPFVHSILPEDGFMKNLVRLLRVFLGNSVEVNLGLTDAIVAIASCSFTNVEGWLLVDPIRYQYDDEEVERKNGLHAVGPRDESSRDFLDHQEAKRIAAMGRAQQRPSWPVAATPPLMATVSNLVDEIRKYRSDIPDFDAHLAQRKLLLHPLSESKEETTASPPMAQTATHQSQPQGADAEEDTLRRNITIRPVSTTLSDRTQGNTTQSSDPVELDAVLGAQLGEPAPTTVTANHLLTNTIILQDFILELVAIIQVRASVFEDVVFL